MVTNCLLSWVTKLFQNGVYSSRKKRFHNRSSMQAEKFQSEGALIMPETRFTSFLASSVDPRVGISWSALETDD